MTADTSFDYENAFYLTAQPMRFGKLLAQYELFKMTLDVPGAIVECGVFKGASFARFAMLRELLGNAFAKPLIGFDTFDTFAEADSPRDEALRQAVVSSAGKRCISAEELMNTLVSKGCDKNVELIAGNVSDTIPEFLAKRPEFRASLINVDLDFYSGSKVAIKALWPRLATGGILMLDDYGVFEGETYAVEELLPGARIKKFPFCYSPSYVVKE